MKQIVVISGKGGTGKTVITGAFAALSENKVMADCDVDAADLHLLLQPDIKERHIFKSGLNAYIDNDKCIQCGKCVDVCRFSAIKNSVSISGYGRCSVAVHDRCIVSDHDSHSVSDYDNSIDNFIVEPISCEGCGFCSIVCPVQAISMNENEAGEWFISDTRFGPMVHARLGIAEENSGKLVTLVRKKAKEIAEEKGADWIIIDGSPGIGCPVIASLSGIDCAVIVTEPTLSGLHDMDRVIRVAKSFNVPVLLIINKSDLNIDITDQFEKYSNENNIELLGKLKFDKTMVEAVTNGKTIIEYTNNKTTENLQDIWKRLRNRLKDK